jgi:hypothetical protein
MDKILLTAHIGEKQMKRNRKICEISNFIYIRLWIAHTMDKFQSIQAEKVLG